MARLFIAATGCSEYIEPPEAGFARPDLDFQLQQNEVNMAERTPQTLANHVRFDPPFHYFVLPVFAISWIISVVFAGAPSGFSALLDRDLQYGFNRCRDPVPAIRAQSTGSRNKTRRETSGWQCWCRIHCARKSESSASVSSSHSALPRTKRCLGSLSGLCRRISPPADIKKAIKNWRPDYWRV